MIINTNVAALNSQRRLGIADRASSENMAKLSSGLRINSAADDGSGLAVSEKLRSQTRGLKQAGSNIQSGISFLQTTEGYLNETTNVLQRIRELSVQSSNGVYSDSDRTHMDKELNQLVDEVSRVASHAQFNGMNMLTGRFAGSDGLQTASTMALHVGANMDQKITTTIGTMSAEALGLRDMATGANTISLSTSNLSNRTIGVVDKALEKVLTERSSLGAVQNRLELAYDGIQVAEENMKASESQVRDLDMASESVDFAKNQILRQASTAMLAQANAKSQGVLQLLQ
jgi:flagellin